MENSDQTSQASKPGSAFEAPAGPYKLPHGSPTEPDQDGSAQNQSPAPQSDDISPSQAPAQEGVHLSKEEQEEMFRALRDVFERDDDGSFDLQELLTSLDVADADAQRGRQNLEILHEVRRKVCQLWKCKSEYMARTTELLANGSRDPKWRAPFGRSGVLDFYLRVVATTGVDNGILLHALRLIGNSCADTDENRRCVVEKNYTLPIIKLFNNPALVHVAVPVIYNICVDFEPAQAQVASNGVVYTMLRLLTDGLVEGNALLTYTYELVEIASEQGHAIDTSPNDSLQLILGLVGDSNLDHGHFASLVNCLLSHLQNERFQRICIDDNVVEAVLSVLQRSYRIDESNLSADEEMSLVQLRLKINQTLSDISALPTFSKNYPPTSSLTKTLLSWLGETSDDQLQICACVILGNTAREDGICEYMIQDLEIHLSLISILNSDAKGSVLHATVGFLKNLTIAGNNRDFLGAAGVIKAVSRLWAFDSIPQVQFMAASLTRQVIASSVSNIAHLLESLSSDPDSPANSRTYLSLLLSLFAKTDSQPIRTEIGRTVAAICRSILRLRDDDLVSNETQVLVDRLFGLHEDVARPIGAMITQTEWPVVQSEGWFALALMAWSLPGSVVAADCIEDMSVTQILNDIIRTSTSEPYPGESAQDATARLKKDKDRDNAMILVHGLLKNNPHSLTQTRRDILEDLMHAARGT